jgi:hypothetical protein
VRSNELFDTALGNQASDSESLSSGEVAKLLRLIDVTVERLEGVSSMYSSLTWTRKGTTGRPLVHVGDRAFYPAGVPSVRIQFAVVWDSR